jgi:hypothetical protein
VLRQGAATGLKSVPAGVDTPSEAAMALAAPNEETMAGLREGFSEPGEQEITDAGVAPPRPSAAPADLAANG